YSFLVSVFVYKGINIKNITTVLTSATETTASIMFILGAAGLFSWILTIENIPQQVAGAITSISDNPSVFLLFVALLLLLVGMFMETNASIMILAPILVPVAVEIGVDPVHFGIVMIITLALGMVTPPMGLNLFIVGKISNTRIDKLAKALIPFYITVLIVIVIITFIPEVSTFLVDIFDAI